MTRTLTITMTVYDDGEDASDATFKYEIKPQPKPGEPSLAQRIVDDFVSRGMEILTAVA